MRFGLKNAGATYQRLVTKMFREEIKKSMEVYIDDMLVKSKRVHNHISNLTKTFQILRHYRIKLMIDIRAANMLHIHNKLH